MHQATDCLKKAFRLKTALDNIGIYPDCLPLLPVFG